MYSLASLNWLNCHHLNYFWVIAREGSIKQACKVLSLSQPALSAQLPTLENAIGEKLFSRIGRKLVLTDVGQEGHGLLPGSSVVAREITCQYQVRAVGHIAELTERFYGITVDRRIKHPAVLAISKSAKDAVFA